VQVYLPTSNCQTDLPKTEKKTSSAAFNVKRQTFSAYSHVTMEKFAATTSLFDVVPSRRGNLEAFNWAQDDDAANQQ